MSVDGLTIVSSQFDPVTTMNRLVAAVEKRGIGILARIDHAGAAQKAGLTLRPTELLIFGNPKVGTALMQAGQTAGIDLPLKALVWSDAGGKTWLAYDNPAWIAGRHGITGVDDTVKALTAGLAALAKEATESEG
ncbi:MAG TPA: DUF302 domain-containing protein [Rhizomicrobium sp.]|nr:DUF302 domain-containing protein [Rhizomicrobium sp.]